jgi:hypothetical protein
MKLISDPKKPEMLTGDISRTYKGTIAEFSPTTTPQMALPIRRQGRPITIVIEQPTIHIKSIIKKLFFLPNLMDTHPEAKAPNNAPKGITALIRPSIRSRLVSVNQPLT